MNTLINRYSFMKNCNRKTIIIPENFKLRLMMLNYQDVFLESTLENLDLNIISTQFISIHWNKCFERAKSLSQNFCKSGQVHKNMYSPTPLFYINYRHHLADSWPTVIDFTFFPVIQRRKMNWKKSTLHFWRSRKIWCARVYAGRVFLWRIWPNRLCVSNEVDRRRAV